MKFIQSSPLEPHPTKEVIKKNCHQSSDWGNLVGDILLQIFSDLSFENLRNISRVCKKWKILSQYQKLGLNIYLKVMRSILTRIELKKMDEEESKILLNLPIGLSPKHLNTLCDLLPNFTWKRDIQKIKMSIDFQSFLEKNDSNSRDLSSGNRNARTPEIHVFYLRTLIIERTIKHYFLKCLYWGALTKPLVNELYKASEIISHVKLKPHSPERLLTHLERKILIEASIVMNEHIKKKVIESKVLDNQKKIIEHLKKDAYFGY